MLEIKSLSDFDGCDNAAVDDELGASSDNVGGGCAQYGEIRSGAKVITKLTSGLRDTNRVNVFLDGKFAFSLDVAQIVELGVKVGQKVDAERLEILRSASEFGKLYQRALEWALTRPHSMREAREYLRRCQQKRLATNRQRAREEKKPFPEIRDDTTELVLERLAQHGYLDDQKLAEYYIENRFTKKGVSQKRLRMELQKKGISNEVIEAALAAGARNDDDELQKMLAKKRARYDDQKLIAYLARQGFNYQKVVAAVAASTSSSES